MLEKDTRLLKYGAWIVIPLFGILYYSTLFIMSNTSDYQDGFNWIVICFFVVQLSLLWTFAKYRLNRSIKKGSDLNIVAYFSGVIVLTILSLASFYILKYIIISIFRPELELFDYTILVLNILDGFLRGVIIMSVLYAITYYKELQKKTIENELLKSNELELKNKALKSQLNPHFLFNNLNTLSGLIKTNSKKADIFLHEMSNMYRYILKINDFEIVSLKEEIDFAENYNSLLNKRFGDNYNCTINVTDFDYSLPPISVHLLLDNIVKHNKIDNQHQIIFSITQLKDYLIVTNTLCLKSNVESSGKGLFLLQQQYKFLTKKPVKITQTDTEFSVALPLLKII